MVRAGCEFVACPKFPLVILELTYCEYGAVEQIENLSPGLDLHRLSEEPGSGEELSQVQIDVVVSGLVHKVCGPGCPLRQCGGGNWDAGLKSGVGAPKIPAR